MCSIQHLHIPRLHEIRLQVLPRRIFACYGHWCRTVPLWWDIFFYTKKIVPVFFLPLYPKYCAAIIWKKFWTFDLIEEDVNVLKKLFRKLSQIFPGVIWVNWRFLWFSNYRYRNRYHITKLKTRNTVYTVNRSGTEIFKLLLNKFLATVLKLSSWFLN